MQQKVLIVTPIALFEIVNDKTVERGNCACAIVALPGDRPKYSLVCYNDARETLCVGALSSTNEDGIQFELQVSMYATFRDNTGKRWSCMFLNTSQVESFLAVLGIAVYALSGHPAHATVITDFAPPTGEVRVGLQHLVKVRYSAFTIRKGEVLQLGELVETNGDESYKFRPVQSAMALHPESKGFECGVLGMMEDSARTVVVPATLPRGGRHLYGADSVAFVVQIIRILHEDAPARETLKVPIVFADGGNNNNNNVVPWTGATPKEDNTDSNGTKVVVLHIEGRDEEMEGTSARRRRGAAGAEGSFAAGGCMEGSGVPAQHMTLIQKLGVQVNNATTGARDVRDMVLSVAGEWKQAANPPKPSTLTNAALEQAVKQLIMDNERVREDITRRDELLRALDHRNRELQKRVDASAMMSQQVMDEKSASIRNASDIKLEKDRTMMKLQEQINQALQERDDTERHLQTVKKLLGVSDEELRQARDRIDLHNIKAQNIVAKLDTMQDAFAEERSRRKGLEARVVALQEEISDAEAELHIKTAQFEDVRRMADMERVHHAQIMSDEQQRRGDEVRELRGEIIAELQTRESAFQADRTRLAEDHFKRGQAEGKVIGRREARIDVVAQMDELHLDVQRALTELDASKTDLRRATEDGMALNRTLSRRVAELKAQMCEDTRMRVRLEFQIVGARTGVRCARDKIITAFTSVAYRLRRPAERSDLLQLLDAAKNGEELDWSFQERARAIEEADAMRRRLGWMEAEMLSLYSGRCEAIYRSWVEPLLAEHQATVESVRCLWEARDGAAHYELSAAETRERFEIVQQMETFFVGLAAFREARVTQQRELLSEVEHIYTGLLNDFTKVVEALDASRVAELQARQQLSNDFMAARAALEEEEEAAFFLNVSKALSHLTTAAQDALMEREESDRAVIDADQCEEFSGMFFDYETRTMAMLQFAALSCIKEKTEEEDGTLVEEVVEEQQQQQQVEEEEQERELAEDCAAAPHAPLPPVATTKTVDMGVEEGASSMVNVQQTSNNSTSSSSMMAGSAATACAQPGTNALLPVSHPTASMEAALLDASSDGGNDNKNVETTLSTRRAPPAKRMPPPKSKLFDSSDSDW